MALSDEQIERYSRQIIVSRIGGRAQERLLAARLLLAAPLETIAAPLAYLVGAGVGTIRLAVAEHPSRLAGLIARMSDLNSDVTVSPVLPDIGGTIDLLFAIVNGNPTIDAVRALSTRVLCGPSVMVRLDSPARIAVLPSPPPCLRCAAGEMLGPFSVEAENSEFPAMAACVEVLKLLSGYEPASPPSIVEFDGYASVSRPAVARNADLRCACGGGAR